jgi:hypothetical protein
MGTPMVYGLTYGQIMYLLAAIHLAGGSTATQVDAVAVREEVHHDKRASRELAPEMEYPLWHRGMITTKGAGRVDKAGVFWVTEKGFEVAVEARKRGYSWPPKL